MGQGDCLGNHIVQIKIGDKNLNDQIPFDAATVSVTLDQRGLIHNSSVLIDRINSIKVTNVKLNNEVIGTLHWNSISRTAVFTFANTLDHETDYSIKVNAAKNDNLSEGDCSFRTFFRTALHPRPEVQTVRANVNTAINSNAKAHLTSTLQIDNLSHANHCDDSGSDRTHPDGGRLRSLDMAWSVLHDANQIKDSTALEVYLTSEGVVEKEDLVYLSRDQAELISEEYLRTIGGRKFIHAMSPESSEFPFKMSANSINDVYGLNDTRDLHDITLDASSVLPNLRPEPLTQSLQDSQQEYDAENSRMQFQRPLGDNDDCIEPYNNKKMI